MAKITEDKMKAVMANYRKAYPDSDLFFTEDGNCFLKENMAKAHARKEKIKVIPDLVEKKAEKPDDPKMTEDDALEALIKMELNDNSDYYLLLDLVEALKLEPKGKKKEDLIAVLKPVKDDLSN